MTKNFNIKQAVITLVFVFILVPSFTRAVSDFGDGDASDTSSETTTNEGDEQSSSELNIGVGIPTGVDDEGNIEPKTSVSSMMDYLGTIFSFALKLGTALTALMIIYSGYKYLTSQGNSSAISESKEIIIGSLSGLAMLLLVYLLLNILGFQAP